MDASGFPHAHIRDLARRVIASTSFPTSPRTTSLNVGIRGVERRAGGERSCCVAQGEAVGTGRGGSLSRQESECTAG